MDILDLVNLSVNQTILRSVITHLTTLLVLTALFIFGGSTVHSFSVALIVGVIVATSSSIYVSTNLAVALGISREDLMPPSQKEIDELPCHAASRQEQGRVGKWWVRKCKSR